MTSANIDALGVPSSPSAEGASPRRRLGGTVSFVWYFLIFVLVIVFNLGWLKIKV